MGVETGGSNVDTEKKVVSQETLDFRAREAARCRMTAQQYQREVDRNIAKVEEAERQARLYESGYYDADPSPETARHIR